MHPAARRPANHNRGRSVPKVMTLGHKICNLIKRADDKIDELHFGDGTQAEVAHSACRANDGRFADGCVDDPLPAEAFQQAFAGLESAAVYADVFADQYHRRIAFHLFVHGLLDGFEKSDLCCDSWLDA